MTVRDGAHLFYWLYYADGGNAPAGRPLVIWLEGGPGASSTSYGNFGKLGPLDPSSRPRTSTWVGGAEAVYFTLKRGGRCKRAQPRRIDSESAGEYFEVGHLGSQISSF